MNLRKPCLPRSWYPRNPAEISEFLDAIASEQSAPHAFSTTSPVIAAVAPHAGWYYSGALAARAVAALAEASLTEAALTPDFGEIPRTVAIIGGHLPHGMPALIATEDAVETPFGPMEMDKELGEAFLDNLGQLSGFKVARDRYEDNTVEVLLPMVRYFFPHSCLLWLRFPADLLSFEAGSILAQSADVLGRNLLVLGSTDLTHYGHNYRFAPKGSGKAALDWVKNVNDRRFIDAVESGDAADVLNRAEKEHSACSAGAVLGVMGYASVVQNDSSAMGELLAYGTSADIDNNDTDEEGEIPDSFVGYGAFVWK